MTAHIDREIAAQPELVVIETAWRSPKEQRSDEEIVLAALDGTSDEKLTTSLSVKREVAKKAAQVLFHSGPGFVRG